MESRVVLHLVTPVSATNPQTSRPTLNSWKQIAQYMQMGVRTVQRYEAKLGLPVHRVTGKNSSAVFAFCDEVDQWLMISPTRSNFKAARSCKAFASLFEALRQHAGSCPDCAGDHGDDLNRLAS